MISRFDYRHIKKDILLIVLSVLAAIFLVKIGVVDSLVSSASGIKHVGSFIAGLFFTSMFTIAPAAAVLVKIAQTEHLLSVALFGAVGAVIGDYIIFRFFRDRISEDLGIILKHSPMLRMRAIFKTRLFRYLTPFIGALIIASPLPDELGLAMLGISKLRLKFFIPISFSMNFLGIYVIGVLARVIL